MPEPKPEHKEEEQGEFKVVDRRLFTQEGERRSDVPVEPIQPPVAAQETPRKSPPPKPPASAPASGQARPSAAQPSPAPPPADAQPQGKADDKSAAHFEHLVMSLMTTAMYQMGLAARPGEQPPPPDFNAAQETIDLLTTLQEKTKGNLSMAEEDMLTGGLYELRMAFVELTRRMGRPIG